jgi:hypothetical protein
MSTALCRRRRWRRDEQCSLQAVEVGDGVREVADAVEVDGDVIGQQPAFSLAFARAIDDGIVTVDVDRVGSVGCDALHPVVHEEQGGVGIATVGRAREVVWFFEPVGRLLDVFERVVVPTRRGALGFGEHDEALAAVDELAEGGPGRPGPVLVEVAVEPGACERVGRFRRGDGVLDD